MSYPLCPDVAMKCSASPCTSLSRPPAPSRAALSRSALCAAREVSTITTSAAPRESASNPSAPEPANRSRQRLPLKSCPSQLKSFSRTRSGVGRRSAASGNRTRRLRQAPPMMRTALVPFRRTDDDGDEPFGPDVPRERRADARERDALDLLRKVGEPAFRQPIEAATVLFHDRA